MKKSHNKHSLFPLILLLLPISLLAQQDYAFDLNQINARRLFNQGMSYFNQHSYEAAVEKFFESIMLRGRDNHVRYWLGMAFYKGGYTDKAILEWENIIKLGGQDSLLVQKINTLYYAKGKSSIVPVYDDYVHIKSYPVSVFSNFKDSLYPTYLYIDEKQQIQFLDFLKGRLGIISPNGTLSGFVVGNPAASIPYLKQTLKQAEKLNLNIEILRKPYNMFVDEEGSYFITDFENNKVFKYSKEGEKINSFGEKGYSKTNLQFLGPQGIASDLNGNLFIADTGNCRIMVCNRDGEFLYTFGSRGKEPGSLMLPSALTFDINKKTLYVCDSGNNRISLFNQYGEYIDSFGTNFLLRPRAILYHPNKPNSFIIADRQNVYLYDSEKTYYKSLFYNIESANQINIAPLSLAIDSSGFLYVGNGYSGKIECLSPLKLRYVNLNVQVENIYLKEFPKVLATVSVKTKEGTPLGALEKENFVLKENGIEKEFILNKLPEEYNNLRLTLLLEKSLTMQENIKTLETVIKEFPNSMNPSDQLRLLSYGGTSFKELLPYNNSVLKNSDAALASPWHTSFQMGTVLKKAINFNLSVKHKKAIVFLTASPATDENFLPEDFTILTEYAAHNAIPIYILYLGRNTRETENFYFYKTLAKKTGGAFIIYNKKASVEQIIEKVRTFETGYYTLSYQSFPNTLKSGIFRPIEISVFQKGLSGMDRNGGYPIP